MTTPQPQPERTNEERQYLNHIRRLQEQNRALSEALAEERILRQQAYRWYQNRLSGRFMWIIDAMLASHRLWVSREQQRFLSYLEIKERP